MKSVVNILLLGCALLVQLSHSTLGQDPTQTERADRFKSLLEEIEKKEAEAFEILKTGTYEENILLYHALFDTSPVTLKFRSIYLLGSNIEKEKIDVSAHQKTLNLLHAIFNSRGARNTEYDFAIANKFYIDTPKGYDIEEEGLGKDTPLYGSLSDEEKGFLYFIPDHTSEVFTSSLMGEEESDRLNQKS